MSELYWLGVLGFWIFLCSTDGEEPSPIVKKC